MALGSSDEQLDLLRLIISKDLTVRETELHIQNKKKVMSIRKATTRDPYLLDLEKKLTSRMMAPVKINYKSKKGAIEIRFSGNEELDRLLNILMA